MNRPFHIIVDISSHGYGHAAMTAPVINLLQQRHPNLKITLKTQTPLAFLEEKYHCPFDYLPIASDFGMQMTNAFKIDREASLSAYRRFHSEWINGIDEEMEILQNHGASMLISNIAYRPLIAAKQLDIPSIALGCLNWAEIFTYYFPNETFLYQQILTAYQKSDCFIRVNPAMPMKGLTTTTVGPLATGRKNLRENLIKQLNVAENTHIVLVSMGGIKTVINGDKWPHIPGVHYVAGSEITHRQRSDITDIRELEISFSDALHSCDALLTKPGYSTFTEAAQRGTPVLYVDRNEWPEQPCLIDWLKEYSPCQQLSLSNFRNGKFGRQLITLLADNQKKTPPSSGVEEAVNIIERYLPDL